MLQACLEALDIKKDGIYVDATFGGGGHSMAILQALGPNGKLIAFDQDPDAKNNLPDDPRLIFVQHNFRFLKNFLKFHGVLPVDGVLADLGVSSYQLDTAHKGFSYRFDGPLDMRMDPDNQTSAADLVNHGTPEQLYEIFHVYGDLTDAHKITRTILAARQEKPITTTTEFVQSLKNISPKKQEYAWLSQVFQALRIAVNAEIEVLEILLNQAAKVLKPEGRLVVLTYHSIEDRMVKKLIRDGQIHGQAPKDAFGNSFAWFRPLSAPNRPDEKEIDQNTRSRSAHLRAGVRTSFQNQWN